MEGASIETFKLIDESALSIEASGKEKARVG
jgi:hypothetical protein